MLKELKILRLIIGIIVSIICITILLIPRFKNKNDSSKNNSITTDNSASYEYIDDFKETEDFKKVVNYDLYYSTKNIVNSYIDYLKRINGDISLTNRNRNEERQEGIKAINNILDEEYLTEFETSESEIIKIAEMYKQNGSYNRDVTYDVNIKEIYYADMNEVKGIKIILIKLYIGSEENNIIVKMDLLNETYSLLLDDYVKKYNIGKDAKIENIKIKDENIEQNEYNKFEYVNATEPYIVLQYFSDFKEKVISNSDSLYDLIEEEYRDKKFGNINSFKEYIEKNSQRIRNTNLTKYLVNNYEDYKEYVCIDENEYYYIVREKSLTDYKIILDTYTVNSNEFLERYNKANDQVKVGMNVDKIISALNDKDYNYVYQKLDETFRKNNYASIEQFVSYINKNTFDKNTVEYNNFTKEGELYIYQIKLKPSNSENTQTRGLTIIMKLLEDANFVMSFSVN